jgi:hypothetical protein
MLQRIHLSAGSVCWPVAALTAAAQGVRHAQTRLHPPCAGNPATGGFAGGVTRWGHRHAELDLWLEWDWMQLGAGTVVQVDPLGVRCNALLLDERDRPMAPTRRRAALATLVYLLPWQTPVLAQVRQALSRKRPPQPAGRSSPA